MQELTGPASEVAPRLLGSLLVRTFADGSQVTVRIVETEAYDQTDAASHSYRGRTPRTDIMFGPPGHLYVYFTYGMHYCCNIVTGTEGEGSAVLIRAVELVDGELPGYDKTNGPARLCKALRIDKLLNGHDLSSPPLQLELQPPPKDYVTTTRIGISQAQDKPWRFYLDDSDFVSVRAKNR